MVGKDIKAKLNYCKDEGPGKRPYSYAYQPGEEEKKERGHIEQSSGGQIEVEVTLRDARSHPDIALDKNAFELFECETQLDTEEFYTDLDKVKKVYYPEIAELMKKATGAEHVMVFHHQVRDSERNNSTADTGTTSTVQPYAFGIHSDSHAMSAKDLFKMFAPSLDPKYQKGRFLYINAWRNISDTPIVNNTLAVLDETSTVKPDDYIVSDFFDRSYQLQQYRLLDSNSERHRWYYYPEMKKNEVLLFKQWDSDPELTGRLCFHTAFNNPSAPSAPSRQSVEARGIAFFPDHEPNTCPPINVDKSTDISIPRATDIGRVKSKHVFNLPLDGVYDEEMAKLMDIYRKAIETMLKPLEDAEPEKYISTMKGMYSHTKYALSAHSSFIEKCNKDVAKTSSEDGKNQVEIIIHRPKSAKEQKTAAVMFVHPGGPLIGGNIDSYSGLCSSLSLACDVTVISVNYCSVVDTEFPGPVNDLYDALKHVANNADSLNVDETKIGVMGIGPGGYLVASLMVKLAQENETDLVKMALPIDPYLDDTCFGEMSIMTDEERKYVKFQQGFWNSLASGDLDSKSSNPLFYPGKISNELLVKCPPTVVLLSEFGRSITDGTKYSRRLRVHGRLLELVIQPGTTESTFQMQPSSEVFKQFMEIIKGVIKAYLLD